MTKILDLLLSAAMTFILAAPVTATAQAAPTQKVLRYALENAETTLDPIKVNDIYSRYLTAHIFEGLFTLDPLARPVKTRPLVALELPTPEDDFRLWTIKLRPGVYFADDPAFKGRRREVGAEDFVYLLKRIADPANKSPAWPGLQQLGYIGLSELRDEALRSKRFDYDKPIPGARALDRYTLQFKLAEARPRFVDKWVGSDVMGAQAREVVEFYGERIDEHPVGSGPFRLAQWRRASRIVFERNPGYRERFYEAEPAANDIDGQAILAKLQGRRLPMVDRVEVSIIDEQQPRWLSFLNGQSDFILRLGQDFLDSAMPGGQIAPNLKKQGMQPYRVVDPDVTYLYFNMADAQVGGYTADKVALRRAIGLGMDTMREIRTVYKNAIVAQSPVAPGTVGYDPAFRGEMGEYDPARAKALLDLFGYVDKDGDGWRDMPDGGPLLLRLTTQPDQRARSRDELMKKNMDALGLKLSLDTMQWPEALKRARAGSLMMWSVASMSAEPDGAGALERLDSGQAGGQNLARFSRPEVDRVLARMRTIADGPERLALFDQAKRHAIAWMPYKARAHRISTDMAQPWLVGYRRPIFQLDWWQYVDIDTDLLAKR